MHTSAGTEYYVVVGDGSERCVICRWRSPDASWYVCIAGVKNSDGRDLAFPICSFEHAALEVDRYEQNKSSYTRPDAPVTTL